MSLDRERARMVEMARSAISILLPSATARRLMVLGLQAVAGIVCRASHAFFTKLWRMK